MRFEFEHQIFFEPITAHKIVFDILIAPLSEQFARVGLERVDARERVGRGVVPREQLRGFVRTPVFAPAVNDPFGVRIAEMRLGGFKFSQRGFCRVEFTEVITEEGINETRLRSEAGTFGHGHSFIHSCMIGNTVEKKDLVQPKPQKVDKGFFLNGVLGFAPNEPIECRAPADDAVDEFLAETSIGTGEMGFGKGLVEKVLDELFTGRTRRDAGRVLTGPRRDGRVEVRSPEDTGRNFSWFFPGHNL